MTSLQDHFSKRYADYLHDLKALTNLDCGTTSKPGVDQVIAYVSDLAHRLGLQARRFDQDSYGDCLYLTSTGRGQARIFMIGHADTVYPDGTAARYPFRESGDRILGAGVNDMKAGLLAGLYALRALTDAGFDDYAELGLFVNSEEEVGSPVSRAIYPELARGASAALVLESARSNGDIVSARKGSGTYHLRVSGRSAHAGVAPQDGANAIVTLAHCIAQIERLNGLREGLTVNVGVVGGGTRTNVVPDNAEAEIDVRVVRPEDAAAFEEKLGEIARSPYVPGTVVTASGSITNPPMPKTEATSQLAAWAKQAAEENGFAIRDVFTGGASDGNMIAGQSVPVLDGLGPVGGNDHNAAEEYVLRDSIVPRVAMLARLIQLVAEKSRA